MDWEKKREGYEKQVRSKQVQDKQLKLRLACTICGGKSKLLCPCGTTQYCTVACQKVDWRERGHRQACKKIRNDRAAEAARAEAPTPPPPPEVVFYGPAPRSHADEIRARIAAEHEAARLRREANPEPEPISARYGSRCPVCLEKWDVNERFVFQACCARLVCESCEERNGEAPCTLCRAPYPKSHAEMLAQTRRHVENDVPEAITHLARAYRTGGLGLPQNDKKAVKIYKRAIELGDGDAMTALGYMYANGEGVKLDPKKAETLYRMGAARGHFSCQYNLGGLERDAGNIDAARQWLALSAAQGLTAAKSELARLERRGR